ncbi:juvenile hormone esterase-like [Colletes gigas]|uniref:juvenile hormone esterase-like n=1 Tax=Colletes gigas TaxID=935657 RepID=UPI001C9B5F3D|nr:juvenile hormone esterase-like [Colletes gigas]
MKCTFVFAISLLATAVVCQIYTPVVQTDKGPVKGKLAKTAFHRRDYSAFLGIPFAKPPVKDLRFKDPVEAEPWKEVLNATAEAPLCMQTFLIGPIGKEDCLYLNVYTPDTQFNQLELKPVLVWIYGGGFLTGGILKPIYGPDWYIEDDIVMVAMNYRLGALGFLALGLPDASGNQGLKDQNLALKWVRRNIAKFGGDPNRVTIMGQSAGASSVVYHTLSPMSAGLFHQGIAQSGSALCPWAYKTPVESLAVAYELGTVMGLVPSTPDILLKRLKKADAFDIIQAETKVQLANLITPISIPFAPTTEFKTNNPFLSDCPISMMEKGNFAHVPMLIGFNADEAMLFAILAEELRQEVHMIMRSWNSFLDPAGSTKYLVNVADMITNATEQQFIKMVSSWWFNAPIHLTQKLMTKYNGDKPVYFYRLAYDTEKNFHRIIESQLSGTAHLDDLPLLFYISVLNPSDPENPFNLYCKRIVSMWSNFIKYSDPTPSNNTVSRAKWVNSGKEGLQLNIGNEEFKMHKRFLDPMDVEFELLIAAKLTNDNTGCKAGVANKVAAPVTQPTTVL